MGERFENKVIRFIRSHLVETALVAYLVPMFWGSLVPFDFGSSRVPGAASATWIPLPVAPKNLADIVSNVVLYMPFGLLLRASLLRHRWRAPSSLAAAVFAGGLLSYLIESSQFFSPSRVSSLADWGCNLLGTLIGAALVSWALIAVAVFQDALARAALRVRESVSIRPSGVIACVVSAVLFLSAIAPFDVTFSPGRVLQSVKDTRVVPFSRYAQLTDAVMPVGGQVSATARFAALRDHWQIRLDYLTAFLGYALLAVFICRYLARHCRVTGARRGIWTVTACGLLAFCGSACRLFVISRSADVTDLLIALIGAAVGVLLSDGLMNLWQSDNHAVGARARRARCRLVACALAGWCLMVFARQLVPFRPNLSRASIDRQVAAIEWMPMRSHQVTRLPVAIDDIVTKLGRYGALAVLICMYHCVRRVDREPSSLRAIVCSVAGAVLLLEAAQILLPSRLPAVTDVILAAFGAASGVALFRLASAYVATIRGTSSAAVDERLLFNVEFDSSKPAPVEVVPPRRPAESRPSGRDVSHPD